MNRICFILPWFIKDAIGGSELAAYNIAKELLSRGWEVFYICEDRSAKKYDQYEGIKISRIPDRRWYSKGLNYWSLKKRMYEIKADYWYCRSSSIYLYPVMVERIARKSGGKTIWALRSNSDAEIHKNRNSLLKEQVPTKFIQSILNKNIPKIPVILVQNNEQQNGLKENYNSNANIIYNGHPVPGLTEVDSRKRENIILWVGHLRPGKRPELFVSLAKRDLSNSIQYKMIASGNELEITQFVENSAQKLPQLEFLGERPVEDVNQLLLRARALVTTSESEGFPNTHIQAWMRGVPVVSTGIDPDDLIKKQGLGIIASSIDELHDAIQKLVIDEIYWNKVSQRCRNFSVTNFDIRRTVDSFIDIITEPIL